MSEILDNIIKNNPNIIGTFITSFLLPIVILLITNRQTRKMKKMEYEKDKNIDIDSFKRKQENIVYSSLVKILFQIQKLHIELSSKCRINYNCITEAIENFQEKFSEYQEVISDNQMYLEPKVTNQLYGFYQTLGDLLIELKEIENDKKYELAIVSVYIYSQMLDSTIIVIQKELSHIKKELKYEIKEEDMYNFINCCGKEPKEEDIESYKKMNPLSRGLIRIINTSYDLRRAED